MIPPDAGVVGAILNDKLLYGDDPQIQYLRHSEGYCRHQDMIPEVPSTTLK